MKQVTQPCGRCGQPHEVHLGFTGEPLNPLCRACELTEIAIRNGRGKFENDPTRQRRLFSGMDCLPGQLDLFKTDGESL